MGLARFNFVSAAIIPQSAPNRPHSAPFALSHHFIITLTHTILAHHINPSSNTEMHKAEYSSTSPLRDSLKVKCGSSVRLNTFREKPEGTCFVDFLPLLLQANGAHPVFRKGNRPLPDRCRWSSKRVFQLPFQQAAGRQIAR